MTRIAIIGTGLSGVTTALYLNETLDKAEITLFEQSKSLIGKGIAYSSSLPYQPLNVRASNMSVYDHSPAHFVEWLKSKFPTIENIEHTFQPRNIFANYIKDEISAKLDKTSIIAQQVLNIHEKEGKYDIITPETTHAPFDFVILCSGNEKPQELSFLNDFSGIIENNPWNIDIETLVDKKEILCIGSGLTTVDLLGSLYKKNFKGRLSVYSRKGLFPRTHVEARPLPDISLTPILQADKTISGYWSGLKTILKNTQDQGLTWHEVLDLIRPHIPVLWKNLSAIERKKFLSRVKSYWEIHRHRMPKESAQIIEDLTQKKQLQVLKGTIDHVRGHQVYIKDKPIIHVVQPEVIINCTGPNTDISSNLLIKNLLDQDLVRQDELKIGIQTLDTGELINKHSQNNIFAIGSLRKGNDYESTAMREIRIQARAISKLISERIW